MLNILRECHIEDSCLHDGPVGYSCQHLYLQSVISFKATFISTISQNPLAVTGFLSRMNGSQHNTTSPKIPDTIHNGLNCLVLSSISASACSGVQYSYDTTPTIPTRFFLQFSTVAETPSWTNLIRHVKERLMTPWL
jgi:hypothetical protein